MNKIVHENNFFSIFGGKEECKNKCPETYKAYENGFYVSTETKDSNDDLFDARILSIGRLKSDPTKVQIVALATCNNKYDGFITAIVTPECLSAPINYKFKSDYVKVIFEVQEDYKDEICIQFAKTDSSILSKPLTVNLNDYHIDASTEITVDDPIKKISTDKERITAYYYNKHPTQYDYSYGGENNAHIQMPSKGTAILTLPVNRIKNYNLTFTNITETVDEEKRHQQISYIDTPSPTFEGNTIKWDVKDDWGYKAQDFIKYGKESDAVYDFYIEVVLKGGKNTFIHVTNNSETKEAAGVYRILPIHMKVDCLAEGTLLQMADGNQKAIQNICIGDELCGDTGNSIKVKNIYEGSKADGIGKIILEDGRSIIATYGHPFMAKNRMISLTNIVPGMALKTDTGLVTVKEVGGACNIEDSIKVYSIELQGESKLLIANGFVVGDIKAEADTREYESNERNFIEKKWLKEYDHLSKLRQSQLEINNKKETLTV